MARKPRIHAPGLLYHVICRGNQRQQVFFDEQDYRAYLHRLAEVHADLPFRLYAYVLMKNHVHMLIEVGNIPLSQIMQILQQRSSQHFNLKYKKSGHLFEGRYKAIVCQRDEYLLTLVRYIHLNPIRAKIVRDPSDYPWSGHNSYLAKKCDPWLDRDAILMQFSKNRETAQHKYKQFILAGTDEGHREDLYELKEQQVLGDDDFVMTLPLGALGETIIRDTKLYPLKDIERIVCKEFGMDEKELRIKNIKKASLARGIFCALARDEGHSQKNLASYLKYTEDNLSHLFRRIRHVLKNDPDLASTFLKLKNRTNNWGQT